MIHFRPEVAGDALRTGWLEWGAGAAETPMLIATAPWGAVAGLLPSELLALGVGGIVVGALELSLRPGIAVAVALGGVAPLADGLLTVAESGWRSASGEWTGVPARVEYATNGGMTIRNGLDGAQTDITAEWSISAQEALGVQLGSALTLPPPVLESKRFAGEPGTTLALQRRSLLARAGDLPLLAQVTAALSAEDRLQLASLPFAGAACSAADLRGAAAWTGLPTTWLRHVTGIAGPDELMHALETGADLLETHAPVALARQNLAWTSAALVDVAGARWREATWPLDPDCDCPACCFALGYLRHLAVAKETLALTLLVQHNFRFLARLIERQRFAARQVPRQPAAR